MIRDVAALSVVACSAAMERTFKEQGSSGFKGGTVSRLAGKGRESSPLTDSTRGESSGGNGFKAWGGGMDRNSSRKTERTERMKSELKGEREEE